MEVVRMQPKLKSVQRRGEVVRLPRRPMSQKEYDGGIRDLVMFCVGFMVALLSIAWLEVG
jgi:hypothetical protein